MVSFQDSQSKELEKMQKRLAQAYGIEETCRRQELVIEKLEDLVKKLVAERKGCVLMFWSFIFSKFNKLFF